MTMNAHNLFEKPINNKYSIKQKLKRGGFGSVYIAKDINNYKKAYAIKLMNQESSKYAEIEYKLYELIEKQNFTSGFIKYYEHGQHMSYKYIVMELIGEDLDELKTKSKSSKFNVKTCLMVGLQLVDRLEALHKIGFVHRDVKPDNMAVGLKEKETIIYLFDFGLAKKIGNPIPQEEKGKVIGTLAFMSCHCHEGIDQGPADDIESLIYSLLYLMEGTLPWMKIKVQSNKDFHKILLMKKTINKSMFSNTKIPKELFEVLSDIKAIPAKNKIDYLKIKYIFLQSLQKIHSENDYKFQWCLENKSKTHSKEKKVFSPLKKNQNHILNEKDIESPEKLKKMMKMKEQNQQIIQNQIYNVYKFIDKENPQEKKEIKLEVKKEQNNAKSRKNIKNEQKQKKQQRMRPVSAVNKEKKYKQSEGIYDKIKQLQQMKMSGPKIVINKTAKHKI